MSSSEGAERLAPPDDGTGSGPSRTADPETRVLVVTVDPAIGPVLERALREAGHEVALVGEGRAALAELRNEPQPNLVLVDLALPDMRGTELCRAIRAERATRGLPIVVVTSRDSEADRIVAFELGADDFVGAPFSVREVLLRIRVQLRRRLGEPTRGGVIEIGSLRLDREAHRAWVDDKEVGLSVREFRLLQALMERSERVLSRQMLLDLVWGTTANVGVRAVDAYVTRLRRKLGSARDYVETVSSVGYRLKRPVG
jgi:two-component system phosphate regulon response regulator PhoB